MVVYQIHSETISNPPDLPLPSSLICCIHFITNPFLSVRTLQSKLFT